MHSVDSLSPTLFRRLPFPLAAFSFTPWPNEPSLPDPSCLSAQVGVELHRLQLGKAAGDATINIREARRETTPERAGSCVSVGCAFRLGAARSLRAMSAAVGRAEDAALHESWLGAE